MQNKKYTVIPNVGINDNLTGKILTNNRSLCKTLNDESHRRDEISEMYWNLKEEHRIMEMNYNIAKEKLNKWYEVLERYNIHTPEKLDQVLRNERTW